ncbi:MAG: hypothetical protein IJD04_05215 [Desulfovibrionaceae bacterium]|nr:hypothetical protein [Desulfovibrionaceae bacterium]
MKKILIAVVLVATAAFWGSDASASKVRVYCANGKIEVDTRDPEQMKAARGKNTYLLREFNYKTDADKFAKLLGGVGAKCDD